MFIKLFIRLLIINNGDGFLYATRSPPFHVTYRLQHIIYRRASLPKR